MAALLSRTSSLDGLTGKGLLVGGGVTTTRGGDAAHQEEDSFREDEECFTVVPTPSRIMSKLSSSSISLSLTPSSSLGAICLS